MDQKRLLIAAILSLVVLFGWQALFPPVDPAIVDPAAEVSEGTPAKNEPETDPINDLTPSPQPEASQSATDTSLEISELTLGPFVDESVAQFPVRAGDREQVVVIESGSHRAEFTNRGGVLQHYTLLDREETGGGELDLVRRREGGLMPFALVDELGQPMAANNELFDVEKGSDWVRLMFSDGNQRVEKHWQLLAEGELSFSVSVSGAENWGWHLGPGVRNPPEAESKSRMMRRNAVYYAADKVETITSRKATAPVSLAATGASWFGIADNYFLAAVIPETKSGEFRFVPFRSTAGNSGSGIWVAPGPVFEATSAESTEWGAWVFPAAETWDGKLYLGTKTLSQLKAVAPGLEKTVHTGYLKILAHPLHLALLWIHDHIVANYGWSIVLLTLLMRILLFPLTHKSAVSMRKMQALNPRIQSIKGKYRPKLKDKQGRPNVEMQRKMNEEVMGLYKSEGANPAGGCLPMLLQMPVFIAFYSMLPVAVELRNAPWMLWIKDLSMPDPLYALPIIMGASQLIMQRLMPSTGDKAQQRIMLIMPIFFTFMFLKFAAGLVLYWLTGNLLGIGQQLLTNRLLGPPLSSQSDSAAKKKPA